MIEAPARWTAIASYLMEHRTVTASVASDYTEEDMKRMLKWATQKFDVAFDPTHFRVVSLDPNKRGNVILTIEPLAQTNSAAKGLLDNEY